MRLGVGGGCGLLARRLGLGLRGSGGGLCLLARLDGGLRRRRRLCGRSGGLRLGLRAELDRDHVALGHHLVVGELRQGDADARHRVVGLRVAERAERHVAHQAVVHGDRRGDALEHGVGQLDDQPRRVLADERRVGRVLRAAQQDAGRAVAVLHLDRADRLDLGGRGAGDDSEQREADDGREHSSSRGEPHAPHPPFFSYRYMSTSVVVA
jgi:hypothetical protein